MQLVNNLLLLATALCLAAGNVWCAAARSTIPLPLQEVVDRVEIRSEKHRGKDDVYLLWLQSGRILQVDRLVADTIQAGDRIEKDAWSRQLRVHSRDLDLRWSPDFDGMARAMPSMLLTVIVTAAWIGYSRYKFHGTR